MKSGEHSNLINFFKTIFLLMIIFYPGQSFSVACNTLFTNALQSSGANMTLTGGTITTTLNQLACSAAAFNNSGGVDCTGTLNCTATGTFAGTGSVTFPTFTGGSNITANATITAGTYNNVTVGNGRTLTLSGGGDININVLTLNGAGSDAAIVTDNNIYNLYIKTLTVSGRSLITPTGTIRMFINTSTNIAQRAQWNTTGTADKLIIYQLGTGNTMTFNNNIINIRAIIFVEGTATISNTADTAGITGAVLARTSSLAAGTNLTYNSAAVAAANYGPITCTPALGTLDHFLLSLPASTIGQNCAPLSVTVTAKDFANNTVTGYTGQITLKTDASCTSGGASGGVCSGVWSLTSGHAANFATGTTANNGYATYTFSNTGTPDNGVATFSLNYPASGSSNITLSVCDVATGLACNTPASSVTFAPTSFVISANASPTAFTGPVIAGNNFTLRVVAYTPQNGCGVITGYTGNKNLGLWSTYVNPTAGAASVSPCTGSPVPVTLQLGAGAVTAIGSTQATATPFTVGFTSGVSTLNFTARYRDVGRIQISAVENVTGGPTGSTSQFVSQPANFIVTSPSGFVIPGSSSATSSNVQKASQPFTATVTVQESGGCTAGNYGNETSPESVALVTPVLADLVAPAGGVIGGLSFGTVTKTGAGTFSVANIQYSEVGAFNMKANVASNNYLGAGAVSDGTGALVGRFQPDHFAVSGNAPQFATACTSGGAGFTYLDQPFSYQTAPILTVVAQNAVNGTTQNYVGSFKKLSPTNFPAATQVYGQTAGSPAPSFASTAGLPAPSETSNLGTMTYTFSAGSPSVLSLQRPAANATPIVNFIANTTLSIAVADSDTPSVLGSPTPYVFNGGGTGIPFTNATDDFRYGRLTVSNTSGSNVANLSVPMQTQYYNSSNGFVQNTLDNCSAITQTSYIQINNPAPVQGGVATTVVSAPGTFVAGGNTITLTAPGAGITGQTNLQILLDSANANMPWLRFAWPFSPAAYANPQAQVNWGFYQGSPKIIYQRENY